MAPKFVSSTATRPEAINNTAFEVPNVVVVPPEEEEGASPWLCFDAEQPREITSLCDFLSLDDIQGMQASDSHPPVFSRETVDFDAVVMPRRSVDTQSIIQVLDNYDYDDSNQSTPRSQRTYRCEAPDVGNDSEIIEVVKLRKKSSRRENDWFDGQPAPKRPRTLGARASQAFRSIKNLGKASLRSKRSRVVDKVYREYSEGANTTARALRRASRRSVMSLSQMFGAHAASPPEEVAVQSPIRQSAFSASSPSLSSFLSNAPTLGSVGYHLSADDMGMKNHRPSSPALSTVSTAGSRTFSTRHPFSVANLHRLFTKDAAPEPSISSPTSETCSMAPSLSSSSESRFQTRSMSRDSGPSTSVPATPVEEYYPSLASSRRHLESLPENVKDEMNVSADCSFEMRLDSLHFEGLSFDVDEF
ncbi:hypothetical protein FISHEDRAFT_57195 [Fistulina hepatica ATCC 64428]|nr:hypothetical protein FISHEDRAFT_57195 [Fistulina hepatica ATCC 64428]